MFDPSTGSVKFDMTSMGAGTALQMVGNEAQSFAQYQQDQHAASAANQNAKLAEATSAANMANYQRQASRQLGAVRAAVGASGTTFQGSPLEVLGDQAREQALQARLIQYQGQLQGSIYRAQAKGYKQAAQGALFSGLTGTAALGMGSLFQPSAPPTPSMSSGGGGGYAAHTASYNPTQSNYGMQNMPYIPPEKPGEYGLNTYGSDY